MTERWLNVEEIAKHLGIAPITIYRWVEKGAMPSHRLGKFWRFKASEVDHWIDKGEAKDIGDVGNLKQSKKSKTENFKN